jgi:hypothetical protein
MVRKLLLLAAAALVAGVIFKRDKVKALLPGGSQAAEPSAPGVGGTPSGPSNYDAPGPVANTATPVPAPEPQQPPTIDDDAEEAAAAAEAANIGGVVSDYAGPAGQPATEAERPLAEAGEGEAEGQEQAERDLEQAAQPTAPGMSDTERQIDDTIEQSANPLAGEQAEPLRPPDEPSGWSPPVPQRSDEPAPFAEPADEEKTTEFEPPTATPPAEPEPAESSAADAPTESKEAEDKKDDEGGSDWRTWSGRSINP